MKETEPVLKRYYCVCNRPCVQCISQHTVVCILLIMCVTSVDIKANTFRKLSVFFIALFVILFKGSIKCIEYKETQELLWFFCINYEYPAWWLTWLQVKMVILFVLCLPLNVFVWERDISLFSYGFILKLGEKTDSMVVYMWFFF